MTSSVPKDGNTMHMMRDTLCIRARMARRPAIILRILGVLLLSASASEGAAAAAQPCAGDNGGITLPAGFCATVFADNVGHARQMVVAPNGVVYVNTWSGAYYRNDTPPPGGFLLALQDTTWDGRADAAPSCPPPSFLPSPPMCGRWVIGVEVER